jgi:hypothetical protein
VVHLKGFGFIPREGRNDETFQTIWRHQVGISHRLCGCCAEKGLGRRVSGGAECMGGYLGSEVGGGDGWTRCRLVMESSSSALEGCLARAEWELMLEQGMRKRVESWMEELPSLEPQVVKGTGEAWPER